MKNIVTKTIEFIKRHDNIFFIILIFLSIFGITMNVLIGASDELWNFQNVYKMYNGYQIYQDANVIITPLFFLIGEFLFKILGANFLTFRIYNIIILSALCFITYLLLKKLKITRKVSIIFIILILSYITRAQANYNVMALMLGVLGVYLYLNKYRYNSIIQGIILFLVFMTKQNMGVFYAVGLFFCEVFNENNWKERIKNLMTEFLCFSIFLIIFFMYLYEDSNLYHFINYTVLGIGEFASKNIAINMLNVSRVMSLVSINILLTFIFVKIERINSVQKSQLITLHCFANPFTLAIVPIFNDVHCFVGIYLSIILFTYLVSILIKEIELKINQRIINIIVAILLFFICGNSIGHFIFWYQAICSENYRFETSHPFYGGMYEESLIENIDNITVYIENSSSQVIVLSGKAAFYMVPMKNSNGMLDLPFKGNLGKDGEEGLIEQIKSMDNIEILIEKDEESIFSQESKMVRQYIIENMKKIGEIEEFEIYK